MAELRSLLRKDEKIVILAISVDTAAESRGLAAKIAKDGKGELPFRLLSDPGHRTIDAYGLFDNAYVGKETEGIPHPGIFLLDRDRKILWVKTESDYRKRPTIDEIRKELDKLSEK